MGDHRVEGPQTQSSLGYPPSCSASVLSSLACYPRLPLHPCPTHTLLRGKLSPRPHSKFLGQEPALGLPPPPAPSSNLDAGRPDSRRPGWGIPRAQAAFQPATSTSGFSATKPNSQHRDLRVCPGTHSNPIPTVCLADNQVMPALGSRGAPSPNLA